MNIARLKFSLWIYWQGISRNRHLVAINQFVFWWYYKRIPEFYRQWTILKSFRVFVSGYKQLEREWQSEAKQRTWLSGKVAELENEIKRRNLADCQISRETAFQAKKMFGADIPNNANN
jgi:hypothetical protein